LQNTTTASSFRPETTTRSSEGNASRSPATCDAACRPQPNTPSVAAPLAREQLRGDGGRSGRPPLPKRVRLYDRDELRAVDREEHYQKRCAAW